MSHEIYLGFHTVPQNNRCAITSNNRNFNTDVAAYKLILKAENMLSKSVDNKLIPHIILQKWLKLYLKQPRKEIEFCRNMETLLSVEQQLTLYKYTCKAHVF